MRKISREELEQILINHQHWLNEDCIGWEDMKADLHNADLHNANLHNADLRHANLHNADLHNADLYNANLRYADLYNADLNNADLHNANLRYADLRYAYLYNANLYNANLSHANLSNADLRHVDLHNANLRYADLRYAYLNNANLHNADLYNANLYNANLSNADLRYAQNVPFLPLSCPDTGAFTAWKRAGAYIVKLFVPADARRLSATGRKCRCDEATVIAIENEDGTPADVTEVCSDYDESFKYSVHAHISVDNFCEDRWKECSEGIHFFINREEAVNYK